MLFTALAATMWCLQSAVANDRCETIFPVLWVLLPLSQLVFVIVAWGMRSNNRVPSAPLPASNPGADSATLVLFVAAVMLLSIVGFLILLAVSGLPS
jgi:hypothetical protein